MHLTLNRLLLLTAAALLLTVACSDEDTDVADPEADAGADVEHHQPEAEDRPNADSIDPEDLEPAGLERIYVESASSAGVISDDAPLRADSFFDTDLATPLVGTDQLDATSLAGQSPSSSYNSIRYTPADSDNPGFGAALQIWDVEDEDYDGVQRVDELSDQFLGVQPVESDELSGPAFISQRADLRTLVFAGDSTDYVFALTCDVDTCPTTDALIAAGGEIAANH